ncbi:MAG: hypothetical protein ABR581_09745 [Thermoleophilaceae bacterium]
MNAAQRDSRGAALELLSRAHPGLAAAPVLRTAACDLALVERDGGFEPAHPLFATRISQHPEGGLLVQMADQRYRIAARGNIQGMLVHDKVFFADVMEDTDLLLAAGSFGVDTSAQVRSRSAPEELLFEFELSPVTALRARGERVELMQGETLVAALELPSGRDAQGRRLKLGWEVDGSRLLLRYAHRERDLLYPLALAGAGVP